MNANESFELYKKYHDALECLYDRDRIIKEHEAKLASRDERIARLELMLVQMSLELASSKAMEDEHRLYKRKMSNFSMNLSNHSSSSNLATQLETYDEEEEGQADRDVDRRPSGGRRHRSTISQSWSAPISNSWRLLLSEAAEACDVGGNADEPKQYCIRSKISKSRTASRSNSWTLTRRAPIAFIPQAKSEADGNTDKPKQSFLLLPMFRRFSSELTCGSTESSEHPLDTSSDASRLDYSLRISNESIRSEIPGVIFPVTSADCVSTCNATARPHASGSSGSNSTANAEWDVLR